MSVLTILLLAFGVAMDAFAVSVTDGLCYKVFGRKEAFMTAFTFGLFQSGMPVIGYFFGNIFLDAITFLDHWIALLLLGSIGINMIWEGVKSYRNPENICETGPFTIKTLLIQGVATSIDALAIGIGFSVMKTNILLAISSIGSITFFCSLFGVFLGKKFGSLIKDKAEIFGGSILVIIGLRIFIEHMFFS
jgi:manganese efflux pump family protein